ncbi:hypothetical protein [Rothia terrae]|uniref:hypothetical protein n=1 Tax=Rothia terrae TaxID=396015 RepID=UPI0033E91201
MNECGLFASPGDAGFKGSPQKSLGIWVPLAVGMAPLALVRDDAGGSAMKLGNAFAFARFKTQLD